MYAIDTLPVCLLSLYFVYENFDIHNFIYSHPLELIYNHLILLYFECNCMLIKTNSTLREKFPLFQYFNYNPHDTVVHAVR